MDSMMAKLIKSRTKTIVTLEAEVASLEVKRATASTSGQALALDALIAVRRQRLAKVREELRAFQELGDDGRQVEIPGTAPAGLPAPGHVMGKGTKGPK